MNHSTRQVNAKARLFANREAGNESQHQHRPADSARNTEQQPVHRGKKGSRQSADKAGGATVGSTASGARRGRFGWRTPWLWESAAAVDQFRSAAAKEHKDADPAVRVAQLVEPVSLQLQQTQGKSLTERKRIFRELQRQLHPDKNTDEPEVAKLAFQRLMDHRAAYLLEAAPQ